VLLAGLDVFLETRKGVPPAKAVAGALSGLIDEARFDMNDRPELKKKSDGVTITVPYEVLSESKRKP
jgi:hypothetical protein